MAKGDLAKAETAELAVSETDLLAYLDNIQGTQLNDNEKIQFLSTAKAYGLNPFKREIYCNVYVKKAYNNAPEKRTLSIIVGYEVYLKRAERTGLLDGWDTEFTYDENGEVYSCITTIYRKDRKFPFKWEVFFDEQAQYTTDYNTKERKLTAFWEKKKQQLRKVGISQTFRICFPDELGGMPYTSDEMPQVHEVEETTAVVVQPEQIAEAKPEKAKKEKAVAVPKYPEQPAKTEQELYNGLYQEIDSLHSFTELGNMEDRLLNETTLQEINIVALLKHCISRRAELITSVDMANKSAWRLANIANRIGSDNVTALFSEIVEACELLRIEYVNKKFQPMPELKEEAEQETESDLVTDNLPL